jgi:hypothetical protein
MTHEEWIELVERYGIRTEIEYNSLADVGAVPMCPDEIFEDLENMNIIFNNVRGNKEEFLE